jgi:hypothetical protein
MVRFCKSVALGSLAVFCAACVSSEVTPVGPTRPAKPEGCEVKIFPSTTPDYEWTDLATVESACHHTRGRNACIDELRKQVCEAGGDTLYGLKDGRGGEAIIVIGTIALKTGGDRPKTGGTPSREVASSAHATSSSCEPPCSPGYACKERVCIALCNPPCGPGFHCNQQRTCEPTQESPTTAP